MGASYLAAIERGARAVTIAKALPIVLPLQMDLRSWCARSASCLNSRRRRSQYRLAAPTSRFIDD